MKNELYEKFENTPVIAAIKDEEGLQKVMQCDSTIVLVLYGDILNIVDIVAALKKAGKTVFVHVDLISGFGPKEIIVDYMKKYTEADGIMSTKSQLVRRAHDLGMCGILRIFMIDSLALSGVSKQQQASNADIIDVLPGVLPKVIASVVQISKVPVIASGLIRDKEDVMDGLRAGAIAVSTTNTGVWFM